MESAIINQAFSLSDSVFLVLLIALGIAFWRFGLYILRKNDERETRNDEREKRYIAVIQSQADSLKGMEDVRSDVRVIKDILTRRDP